LNLRPLTDQARGALFNILAARVPGAHWLDLFAGTGAVGIEALSRGAEISIFVEHNRTAVQLIRENLDLTGFTDRSEVYQLDAVKAVTLLQDKGAQFDIIYLGAPYDSPVLEKTAAKLAEYDLLTLDGIMVVEHRKQHLLPENFGKFVRFREARYGETVLAFYE